MRRFVLLVAFSLCNAQPAGTIRVDVNLVTVACSASDRNGAPAKELRKEDFSLIDDGRPREIQYFWQETDLPLTIGLIADVSGSQMGEIRSHRETITRFLKQVMGPQDQAFLVAVAGEVKLITDLTPSVDDLQAGVDQLAVGARGGTQLGESCRERGSRRVGRRRILGCGGTALWNGVYAAAKLKMKPVTGRKALIVLSDGMDTGSFHHLTDAIEAAQSADTLVYTLRSLNPMLYTNPLLAAWALAASKGMQRLSLETGGRAFGSRNPSMIFQEIEDELRNLYVLGFTPPEGDRDGKFHKLAVRAVKAGITVRARRGYTAAPRAAESGATGR